MLYRLGKLLKEFYNNCTSKIPLNKIYVFKDKPIKIELKTNNSILMG